MVGFADWCALPRASCQGIKQCCTPTPHWLQGRAFPCSARREVLRHVVDEGWCCAAAALRGVSRAQAVGVIRAFVLPCSSCQIGRELLPWFVIFSSPRAQGLGKSGRKPCMTLSVRSTVMPLGPLISLEVSYYSSPTLQL